MMRSMYSGVAGLKGHQTKMDVVGNNIANVNTTGFKSGRVTFADTLSQTTSNASAPTGNIGGTNPKQIGLGVGVSTIDTLFTDGSVQATGKNTDLCLSGNGLFVVKSGNEEYYTRNGAFEFDANGTYVMPGSGMKVQGYMAVNGDLSGAAGTPGDITIQNGQSMEAVSTTTATYSKNLKADMEGYKIDKAIVKYADGSQETVANYTPATVYEGTITLTTDTGTTIEVDDTAAFDFTTNDPLAGRALWTKKIESVSASSAGTVDLTLDTGTGATLVSGGNIQGLTSGTYNYNGSFTLSGTIETNGVTAVGPATDPNSILRIRFDLDSSFGTSAGQQVVVEVPRPESGSYSDGDTVSFSGFKIVGMTAAAGATVNCADGRTDELQSNLTVSSATQTYVREGRASDGNIATITRNGEGTSYHYNNKIVSSVDIVDTSGAVMTGLVGKDYSASDTFYNSITTTVTIYDSDSGTHAVPVVFTKKAGAESTWEMTLAGGSDSYSKTEDDGTTMEVALTKTDLVFDEKGKYVSGDASLAISYSGSRAVEDTTVTLNLNGLTQFADTSTISNEVDGNTFGTLKSVAIDSSGVITGVYTNGIRRNEAKIAIATFSNLAGLTKTGGSLYQVSNNSGSVSYDGTGCTITASALEMSNVDIANEFSDMIITQRGFQSNSKIITVSDEMLETMINMKR